LHLETGVFAALLKSASKCHKTALTVQFAEKLSMCKNGTYSIIILNLNGICGAGQLFECPLNASLKMAKRMNLRSLFSDNLLNNLLNAVNGSLPTSLSNEN